MAKNYSIKKQIGQLMKEHPKLSADELYPLAPFKTKKSYFDIIYNQYKYSRYPQTAKGLKKKYPKVFQWISKEYEDTSLSIPEIAEHLGVDTYLIIHTKKMLGILKYPENSKNSGATVFDLPKNIKNPSISLEVGDTIRVTKHYPVDLRDIFICGRCKVIFKNKRHIVIRDSIGLCHSFNIQLFDNYIEYEEVSN